MKQCITACLLLLIISCIKSPEIEIKPPTIEGDYLCMDTVYSETLRSIDTSLINIINSYHKQRTISVSDGGYGKYFVDLYPYRFNHPFGFSHYSKGVGGYSWDSLYIDGKVFFHITFGLTGDGEFYQKIIGKKIE